MVDNNFDYIAPVYNRLLKLSYGGHLDNMTTCNFNYIPNDSSLLILGGGTGNILKDIPKGIEITYLDKSQKMIEEAQKLQQETVHPIRFICADFLKVDLQKKYQVVLAPFFLDVFSAGNLALSIDKVRESLVDDGVFLVSDFYGTSRFRDRIWMAFMHVFFKLAAKMESGHLKDIRAFIVRSGFSETMIRFSEAHPIFSACYMKKEES